MVCRTKKRKEKEKKSIFLAAASSVGSHPLSLNRVRMGIEFNYYGRFGQFIFIAVKSFDFIQI